MKKPFTVLVLLLCVLVLTSCNTVERLGDRRAMLPVQYATLKLIEGSDITAEGVAAHVERVRTVISDNPSVSLSMLAQDARQAALIAGLDPADQLLLNYLLGLVEVSLEDLNLLDEAQRLNALTVLDWVEQAALLY